MQILNTSKAMLLAAGAAIIFFGSLAAAPAEARTFVSVGVGLPLVGPPLVYAPPPVVYAPPPVVYAPAPVAYAPAPAPAAQTCREYQSTVMINGQPQQTHGTACLQPDGSWRIVQ